MRTVAILVVVAAIAAAGASTPVAAAAAEPTLGATFGPTTLVYEREQDVALTNRSTLPVIATITADGAGWAVDSTPMRLAVGQRVTVTVTAAGPAEARIVATLTAETPPPGMDATSLVMTLRARHLLAWETVDWSMLMILGLIVAAVVALVVRRRLARHGGAS